jgi:predicted dehydrogenase
VSKYEPSGKLPEPVVKSGEFQIAAMALDHGHIHGQVGGLIAAGASLKWVYDADPKRAKEFADKYGGKVAESEAQVLEDDDVKLVAAAAVPNLRGPLGIRCMDAGKDYFTDKTPFTTHQQLEDAREAVKRTGKKYSVFYCERLSTESGMYACDLIEMGAIGQPVQYIGTGPHKHSKGTRPDWFYNMEQYGGILCDIGSHQSEQFLTYMGANDAKVISATVANYANADTPELEDFGDAHLVADNGTTGYYRVDWFTPDILKTFGDGRIIILGTEGYIELRKYVDIGHTVEGGHVYLVNKTDEVHMNVTGKVGLKFFGQLILDCINRTDIAQNQEHAFTAARLCLDAQKLATKVK